MSVPMDSLGMEINSKLARNSEFNHNSQVDEWNI